MNFLKSAFLFTAILLLAGCQPDKAKKEYHSETEQSADLIQQDEVLLLCQRVKNPSSPDLPESEVFFQLAESKMKVADVLDCQTISPNNYTQYDIPANAISAVGGWWAGSGDYLYVVAENGGYSIKKAVVDEMQEGEGYQYQELVRFNKKGELVSE